MKLNSEGLMEEVTKLEKKLSDLREGKHEFGYPKTINELKNRLAEEEHNVDSLQIVCWKKSVLPDTVGIYEEDGVYHVYHTTDRGDIIVLTKGAKEDMVASFYRRILKKEIRYLCKDANMKMKSGKSKQKIKSTKESN